jgi:hypothetical protein
MKYLYPVVLALASASSFAAQPIQQQGMANHAEAAASEAPTICSVFLYTIHRNSAEQFASTPTATSGCP